MGDSDSIDIEGTTFTKQQVDRQTQRIYDFVFIEPNVDDDGLYGGRVKDSIMGCFHKHLVFDEIVSESSVAEMIHSIIKDVSDLIIENVKSVHPLIVNVFSSDFVPACMEQFFTIQSALPPASDYDPAYG